MMYLHGVSPLRSLIVKQETLCIADNDSDELSTMNTLIFNRKLWLQHFAHPHYEKYSSTTFV